MRKILATMAIALVPTVASAEENNTFDGYGSVAAGYSSIDMGEYSYEYGYFYEGGPYGSSGNVNSKDRGLDLEGRVSAAVPLAGALGAQFDGTYSHVNFKNNNCSSCSSDYDELTVALHAFVRNPNKGLIGLVGQRTRQKWQYSPGQNVFYVGVDSQLFLGRVTYSGQMGYAKADDYGYLSTDGLNASIQFRYFPTDNLSFAVRGGHEFMKSTPNSDSGYNCPTYCQTQRMTAWNAGAKVEFRPGGSRFSFLADVDYVDYKYKYDYMDYDYYYYNNSQAAKGFRALIGVKVNFGSQTLFERDRSGASLDPFHTHFNSISNRNED